MYASFYMGQFLFTKNLNLVALICFDHVGAQIITVPIFGFEVLIWLVRHTIFV